MFWITYGVSYFLKQYPWLGEDDLHYSANPFTPMEQETNEGIETETGGRELGLGQEPIPPEVITAMDDNLKRDVEPLTFSIWDFAGQDLYYTTHQVPLFQW